MAVLLQFPQMFLSCLLSSFLIILHLHFSDSAELTLSEWLLSDWTVLVAAPSLAGRTQQDMSWQGTQPQDI